MQTQAVREYETIYILKPTTDHQEAERVANRVSEVIDRQRGKLTKLDNWGRRKLAYPIQKSSKGIFVYLKYLGYNDLVAELERHLRMIDSVVRYQTVLTDPEASLDGVSVDPEAIKFRAMDSGHDDAEPALEQRLGFVSAPQSREERRNEDLEEQESDENEGVDAGERNAAVTEGSKE